MENWFTKLIISNPLVVRDTRPDKPKISVLVFTYNHENFIVECLEGIRSQEFSGIIELIIIDDDSSDDTLARINRWCNDFGDNILLIKNLRVNNIKNRWNQPTGRFSLIYALRIADGDYICICEGDDYWIDKFKLQRQYDFFKEKPNYVFHSFNAKILEDGIIRDNIFPKDLIEIDQSDMFGGTQFMTCASMFKNIRELLRDLPEEIKYSNGGDRRLFTLILGHGKGLYQNEAVSVYRKHQGGTSNNTKILSRAIREDLSNALLWNRYFGYRYTWLTIKIFIRNIKKIVKYSLQ